MFAKFEQSELVEFPIHDIRRVFPNVSFPEHVTQECLPEGYYKIEYDTPPQYDERTQKLQPQTPKILGGRCVVAYEVVARTDDELQVQHMVLANSVRNTRDELLSQSDWTQVADAPVDKNAWAAYRQQLRDVPTQVGFPYSVVWPTKP